MTKTTKQAATASATATATTASRRPKVTAATGTKATAAVNNGARRKFDSNAVFIGRLRQSVLPKHSMSADASKLLDFIAPHVLKPLVLQIIEALAMAKRSTISARDVSRAVDICFTQPLRDACSKAVDHSCQLYAASKAGDNDNDNGDDE